MSKVTSKLQVTLPKALAVAHGIRAGSEIEFVSNGEVIQVRRPARNQNALSRKERLRLFDEATRRQLARSAKRSGSGKALRERGWTRDELYRDAIAD